MYEYSFEFIQLECDFIHAVYTLHCDEVNNSLVFVMQSLLAPHILFSVLYHSYRPAFEQYILGREGAIATFWADVADDPQYRRHPVKGRPNHGTHAIPLGIHGDGVPALGIGKTWQKSFEAWSWGSIVGAAASTLFMNYLIWVYPKDVCRTGTFGIISPIPS